MYLSVKKSIVTEILWKYVSFIFTFKYQHLVRNICYLLNRRGFSYTRVDRRSLVYVGAVPWQVCRQIPPSWVQSSSSSTFLFYNFPDKSAKLPQLFRFSSAFTLTLNQSLPSQEKPFLNQAYHSLALCRSDLPTLKMHNHVFEANHLYHHENLLLR